MGCTSLKNEHLSCRSIICRSKQIPRSIQVFNTICKLYAYKRILGEGKYGQVFLAESPETKKRVAVKAISKETVSKAEIMNELRTLTKLDHPNIVRYLKYYETNDYSFIVTEYCKGEQLLKLISDEGRLTEKKTLDLMEQLLRAVNHCHYLNIIHCDLKPDNIMYSPKGSIKIIDFGLSMRLGEVVYEGLAGTAHYMAPEVVNEEYYTKAHDLWSLGVIMHIMLAGYFIMRGKDSPEIYENIKQFQEPSFSSELWKDVSKQAKDLLKRLLDVDYRRRITASEALNHPWFSSERIGFPVGDKSVMEALKKYSEYSKEKREILKCIVKNASDKELEKQKGVFLELDREKKGFITSSDLLGIGNAKMSKEEIEVLIRKINHKGKPFITYSELVGALIVTERFLTVERIKTTFKILKTETCQSNTSFSDVIKEY